MLSEGTIQGAIDLRPSIGRCLCPLVWNVPSSLATAAGAVLLMILMSADILPAKPPPIEVRERTHRVKLSEHLHWTTSGAWYTRGVDGYLLLVDTMEDRVVRVSPNTGKVDSLHVGSVPGSETRSLPTQIRAVDGGYILLDDSKPSRLLKLDEALEYVKSFAIDGRSIDDGISEEDDAKLTAVFDFLPMDADGAVFAFADLEGPGSPDVSSRYFSAFLYFDSYGQQQIFDRIANDQPERFFYTRNIQYMAVVDNVGYVLSYLDDPKTDFLDPPRVVEARLGIDGFSTLCELPPEFAERPGFEGLSKQGPRKATQIYQRLEGTSMAAGLYSWNDRLYLLGKERMVDGMTPWWLLQLDRTDGHVIGRVRLDTDPAVAHMTVVPGERWAFVQRGRVEGLGQVHAPFMRMFSTMFVPAAEIESKTAGQP